MIYGTQFGDKHSTKDWGVYPSIRPEIGLPETNTNYVEIPYSNVTLDFTEVLTGFPTYRNREITWKFLYIGKREDWSNKYSEIARDAHGKRLKIIMDEDPSYYYMGRCEMESWESDRLSSTITIKATCEPFKYELKSSLEDWLWDPFDFDTDVAREYKDLEIDGTYELEIFAADMPESPEFIVAGSVTVEIYGNTYSLPEGHSKISGLTITRDTTIIFAGKGTVSVDYKGGHL